MRASIAALLAGACVASGGAQTIRVVVDAVRVDVLVTDGGIPVGGLTAADFELRDSGVIQRIDALAFEDVPLSVMLALDTSSSLRGQPLDDLKRAASAAVGLLQADDRSALLTFAEEVDLLAGWASDRAPLERAIQRARVSGSTALHDAAYAALTLTDPERGRALVLMFSDGDDTASWLSGQAVLDVARRSDAVVYGVRVRTAPGRRPGHLVDFRSGLQRDIPRVVTAELARPFLAALAEETGGTHIDAAGGEGVRAAFVRIVGEFRSRYLLTFTPAGVPADGWHPLDVRLKNRKGRITARRGYLR